MGKKAREEMPFDTDLDAVLPQGIVRQTGSPLRDAPDSFETGYELPEHYEKPLQEKYKTERDDKLKFYANGHVYTWEKKPITTSVTTLAHHFQKAFDPVDAISGMHNSKSQQWPRLEYVFDSKPCLNKEWDTSRGLLVHADGKTMAVIQPNSMLPNTTWDEALRLMAATSVMPYDITSAEYYTFAREKSSKEIQNEWKLNGKIASNKGTEAHFLAECFFNGLPFRHWEPEMEVLYDFCRRHLIPKGIVAFNTEKEIYCEDADVAGSIDLIVWDPSVRKYHIIDFKRSDKLRKDIYGYGKMKAPLNHLDDSKGAAYALQTSIYQFILERDYDMEIGERILLSLHPDAPFATSVPYLAEETRFIMEQRFALKKAWHKVASENKKFVCEKTKMPLVDAVRTQDCEVVTEKYALLKGIMGVEVHDRLRKEFEEAISKVKETVVLDKKLCKPWRQSMPQGGITPFL